MVSPQNVLDGSSVTVRVKTVDPTEGGLLEVYISPVPSHKSDRAVKVLELGCIGVDCEGDFKVSATDLAPAISAAVTLKEQTEQAGAPVSGLGLESVKALWLIGYCPGIDDALVIQLNYTNVENKFFQEGGQAMSMAHESVDFDWSDQNFSPTTISASFLPIVGGAPAVPASEVEKTSTFGVALVGIVLVVLGLVWMKYK